jgi:hypothetical protein
MLIILLPENLLIHCAKFLLRRVATGEIHEIHVNNFTARDDDQKDFLGEDQKCHEE